MHPRVLHAEHLGRLPADLTHLSDEEGVAPEGLLADHGAQDVPGRAASTGQAGRPDLAHLVPRHGVTDVAVVAVGARTSCTGLTKRRTTSLSWRARRDTVKAPDASTRSAVTDPASTATATSLGSRQTCTTRLAVIRLTASSCGCR